MAGRVLLRRLICRAQHRLVDCRAQHRLVHVTQPHKIARGYSIDLHGKVAFVAGVADSTGNILSLPPFNPSIHRVCECVREQVWLCVCVLVCLCVRVCLLG